MQLYYRQIGQGQPFVILHGLYGSADNWMGFARKLSDKFWCIVPDLRNHGQSAHSVNFSYQDMCTDICELLNRCGITTPIVLMGHSMGGRVAMEFAKQYPQRVSHLVVVDISPLSYTNYPRVGLLNHQLILQSMLNINLSNYTKRIDVEVILADCIADRGLAQFLLKNLARNVDGSFYWRLNLQAIANNYENLLKGINEQNYNCTIPALFVKAQHSAYITPEDEDAIHTLYSKSKIIEIANANHWVHVDQPQCLLNKVVAFCTNS